MTEIVYERQNEPAFNDRKLVNIVHFNDVYNIESRNIEPVGGAARFVTVIDSIIHNCNRQGEEENTIVLFSGDAFNPSLLSMMVKGRQMVSVLNEMHITAACIGNHDFDFGVDHLIELINATNFPWLVSNVKSVSTNMPLANCKVQHIVQVNGIKIGIIALIEEEWIATVYTIDSDDVIFEDFSECGRRLATELKLQHQVDYVIALTHMRIPNDERLAREVPEIDLILGGHDHDYQFRQIENRIALKSGSDFRELSHIQVCFNSLDKKENYVDRIEKHTIYSQIQENPKIKQIVHSYLGDMQKLLNMPIGVVNTDLEGRFSVIRTQETNLGNFICDIILEAVNADCVILNSGTFRSDAIHEKGEFKLRDLKAILPAVNTIVVMACTGKQIYLALENGVSQYPKLEGRFPQVAGLRFKFDPSKPSGKRIEPEDVTIQDNVLKFDQMYLLATKIYIKDGRDGYDMFKGSPLVIDDENGPILATIVENHFKTIEQINNHVEGLHRPTLVSVARTNKILLELCAKQYGHPKHEHHESNGNSWHAISDIVAKKVPNYHSELEKYTHEEILSVKESDEYKRKILEYESNALLLKPSVDGRIIKLSSSRL